MWALLSSRVRTWLLFAIAVPVLRAVVHSAAARSARKNPEGSPAKLLGKADGTLSKLSRRRKR